MCGDADRSQTTRRMPAGPCRQTIHHGFEDQVGIHVQQRGFGAEGDRVWQRLVLGVAGKIGKLLVPRNAAEERHVRARGARQQHHHRRQRGDQYSVQDSSNSTAASAMAAA